MTAPHKDEVLEELWRVKDTLAAKHDYDIGAMCRAMRLREKRSGHKLVSFALPRPVSKPTAGLAKAN